MSKTTLALIVGTRDFFPAEPVLKARREVIALLEELGVEVVIPPEEASNMGAVETWEDAKLWAQFLRQHRYDIDGILVSLPVFAPERGIADTIKLSELQVPILIQAHPDPLDKLALETRGDSFCGKISLCNNLYQYGYPFSLTDEHTIHPLDDGFRKDLQDFLGVCRVVKGLKRARLGAIGARPAIFNTVRFSEKLLQDSGITVTTIDLSEIIGEANLLQDGDPQVVEKVQSIQDYIDTSGVAQESLIKMAKFGLVVDDWAEANDLDATAIQCWTAVQRYYGINVCTLMSMMSNSLMPSGCEVDVTGVVAMYALQLASGRPSALVDWNNNYGDDPDKCVLFHCGNWPLSFFSETKMSHGEILATVLGQENTEGTVSGRADPSPITFARVSTDDRRGKIKTYVGEGRITADPLDTFGSRAVVEIVGLKELMRYVCKNGFEHHAAMNPSSCADVLQEAFETYMGWEVHRHQ